MLSLMDKRAFGSTRRTTAATKRKQDQSFVPSDDTCDSPEESEEETPATATASTTRRNNPKRRRRACPADISDTKSPQAITLHRVRCTGNRYHSEHARECHYLDPPQLFQGDSKASVLRGRLPVADVDDFIEKNNNASVILYKIYQCTEYYDAIEPQFDPLPHPAHPDVTALVPFFFSLRQDGRPAHSAGEEMIIVSEPLKEAVQKVTSMDASHLSDLDEPQHMRTLYNHFYHLRHRDPTEAFSFDPLHQKHITVLQEFMEHAFGAEYDQADALFSRGRVTKRHLSTLFQPNEILVTYLDGEPITCAVETYLDSDLPQSFVHGQVWNFDGKFYRDKVVFRVDWPSSAFEIDILKLNIYPLRFDTSGLQERLRIRGRKFWECRMQKFVSYSRSQEEFEFQLSKPRYMVDVQIYERMHHEGASLRNYDGPDIADNEPPDESFLLQLPARIRAFGFHDKKWRSLLVEHISDIEWNTEAFKNHLVLRHTKKELIEALIASHTTSTKSTDVIDGKGEGLILLLHGGPGTGKTLTAESVAELTRRPLYRVTCGDIGTNAEEVEKYLESVLYLGARWKCVVLLDEADVFLEERTKTDLQRNALVSVFLRILEYYDGIMILTSNRVGTFDEAFKSRVQLILHYPPLQKPDRHRIWTNFISRLQNTNADAKTSELQDEINNLAEHELNGREIRNALKTAMLLAQFRKEMLGSCHLKEVINISREFENYLLEVHGHSTSDWAKGERIRAE